MSRKNRKNRPSPPTVAYDRADGAGYVSPLASSAVGAPDPQQLAEQATPVDDAPLPAGAVEIPNPTPEQLAEAAALEAEEKRHATLASVEVRLPDPGAAPPEAARRPRVAIVQLARHGDIVNILPVAHELHRRIAREETEVRIVEDPARLVVEAAAQKLQANRPCRDIRK